MYTRIKGAFGHKKYSMAISFPLTVMIWHHDWLVIQGFDQRRPIFDSTLSVDQPFNKVFFWLWIMHPCSRKLTLADFITNKICYLYYILSLYFLNFYLRGRTFCLKRKYSQNIIAWEYLSNFKPKLTSLCQLNAGFLTQFFKPLENITNFFPREVLKKGDFHVVYWGLVRSYV